MIALFAAALLSAPAAASEDEVTLHYNKIKWTVVDGVADDVGTLRFTGSALARAESASGTMWVKAEMYCERMESSAHDRSFCAVEAVGLTGDGRALPFTAADGGQAIFDHDTATGVWTDMRPSAGAEAWHIDAVNDLLTAITGDLFYQEADGLFATCTDLGVSQFGLECWTGGLR